MTRDSLWSLEREIVRIGVTIKQIIVTIKRDSWTRYLLLISLVILARSFRTAYDFGYFGIDEDLAFLL